MRSGFSWAFGACLLTCAVVSCGSDDTSAGPQDSTSKAGAAGKKASSGSSGSSPSEEGGSGGTGGSGGAGGKAGSAGPGGASGSAGQGASGQGGSGASCPPAVLPPIESCNVAKSACTKCLCGSCPDEWETCVGDKGCSDAVSCYAQGCSIESCVQLASGPSLQKALALNACLDGCSASCSGPGGAGGAGGSGGAGGKGGSGGAAQGGSAGSNLGGSAGSSQGGSGGSGQGGAGGSGQGGSGPSTPPTTCDEAHGSVGCCVGETLYYWVDTGLESVDCSSMSKTCGWQGKYYDCVDTGGEDPSGKFPIACGGSAPGDLCTGGAGGAAGSGGSAGASGSAGSAGSAGSGGECSPSCVGAEICNPASGICGECLVGADCSSSSRGPKCLGSNDTAKVCGCETATDCKGQPGGPACDTIGNYCTCYVNTDCTDSAWGHLCQTTMDAQGQSLYQCGCEMDSDCPSGSTCQTLLKVCVQ